MHQSYSLFLPGTLADTASPDFNPLTRFIPQEKGHFLSMAGKLNQTKDQVLTML